MTSHWTDDLTRMPRGTHLCRVYSDERDLAEGAASFVAGGLAAGARVLYVASDRDPVKVEASLEVNGIRAERALATGQLVIRSSEDVYGDTLPRIEDLEAGFRAMQAQARTDGLALRVAAEMGDAAEQFGSLEQLVRWEAAATLLQRETGISSVCQYDARRFGRTALDRLTAEHAGSVPAVVSSPLAGFYFEPTAVRVVGEVDVSNSEPFLDVIEARVDVLPRLDLDLAELTFMDVHTMAALFRLVRRRPEVELTLRNTSPKLRRYLSLVGLQHPRLVVA